MNDREIEAMLAPTWLDKQIGKLSPGWGAARLQKRRELSYEAARNTRLRNSAAQLQGPEDYTAFPDRLQLIRQMRDLVQNFGLFQSIEDKLAMYAFGRIRYQALTGDKKANDRQEEYLADRFKRIDITGRHNLRQIVGITFKSAINDGDYLNVWRKNRGELKLVGVEGDRLGGIMMGSPLQGYFQGITVDPETGEPQSYKVYDRTKANSYTNPVEVPASDARLYYDPRRIDQYRGVTPFAPVINEARDLKELMEAVRIGTKFENYHAAVGYTPNGMPLQQPADFITNANAMANGQAMTEQEIKPGLIQWAPSSAKLEFLKSDRPSGQFQAYLENLIRLIGLALNLPYGFLYSLMGLTGPSARMDAQQALRVIQWHQENMIDRFLEWVKNTLLMEAFATGALDYAPNWHNGRWHFTPWITIDAGNDSAARINEWKSGLRAKETIFAEDGYDAEEQEGIIDAEANRTVTRAKVIASTHEIPLELALTMLEVRTPNGFVPRNAPQESVEGDGDTSILPNNDGTAEAPNGKALARLERRAVRRVKLPKLLGSLEARKREFLSTTNDAAWLRRQWEQDDRTRADAGPAIVVNVAAAPAPQVNFAAGAITTQITNQRKTYDVARDAEGTLKITPHG